MSTAPTPSRPPSGGGSYDEPNSAWVTGLVLFAGVVMMVNGVLELFQGIMAIANDDVFVTTPRYVFRFDLTGWGWFHLFLGLLLAGVGFGVIRGATWARYTGIVVTSVSVLANFLSLPYYPFWSIILIALDVFVIWALCVYRKEPSF
jgi:hypothetical protein